MEALSQNYFWNQVLLLLSVCENTFKGNEVIAPRIRKIHTKTVGSSALKKKKKKKKKQRVNRENISVI